MKAALRQGGPDALNFYSTTAGEFLGWAYLPDIVTKPGQAYLDGVVSTGNRFPARHRPTPASTTRARRHHEVGHWLNLEHTFYGGCNAKGDFVDDTPPERTPTSGCPRARTPAPRRARTRSTTTWTTRTTAATRSSRPARRSGCATRGCCIAHHERVPDAPRWWTVRPAQNLKPATYRCPFCDQYLSALSEHLLVKPEGDDRRRRHAHTACVLGGTQGRAAAAARGGRARRGQGVIRALALAASRRGT